MKKYVLGVDGGGTKTHYALYNIENNSLKIIEGGAANHEVMEGGFDQLEQVLNDMLSIICNDAGINLSDINMSVFGLAGVDTKAQHKIISEIITKIGIKDFVLCNDSYLGIKAGCEKGYGICANNGTGFTVSAIDTKGDMIQIGGQGYFTGDNGGGSAMITTAVCKVYEQLYKLGEETMLKDLIFSEYNIVDKSTFTEIITKKLENDYKDAVLTIGKHLYEAANSNDKIALDILYDVGVEYGKSICGAINELNFNGYCQVIMTGSQFVKGSNPRAKETMKAYVQNKCPNYMFDFKLLKQSCSMGAILWALEKLGMKDEHYENVLKCFG